MTDTNNKETFESEIKECLDMCSVNTDWVNKAVKYRFEKLKQLHDKEIKELQAEVERLKGIIKLETSQNKENIQNIVKLQAEVERLKDFPLNKLKKGW